MERRESCASNRYRLQVLRAHDGPWPGSSSLTPPVVGDAGEPNEPLARRADTGDSRAVAQAFLQCFFRIAGCQTDQAIGVQEFDFAVVYVDDDRRFAAALNYDSVAPGLLELGRHETG